ncbi:MAG: peptide/nickel transport system permease protein [Planctomycetota bacterium]|jgi:peptide/nickel transport system permease protein
MNNRPISNAQVLPDRPLVELWSMFYANKAAIFGLALWLLVILMAIFGLTIYPNDPFEMVGAPMTAPGEEFWLGTDYLGRDVLTGVIHGAAVTLAIGFSATICTAIIGVIIGVLSGFYGGWVDNLLMRVTEFFQVLPPILFVMVLISLFTPSIYVIVLAIAIVSWPGIARLTRAEFLRIKELEYVMAERAMGAANLSIMFKVIVPNALPPLIVAIALNVGTAILFEAALSFLGLGDPNAYSWGYMIGSSREYIWDSWWTITFPGLAIFLTVLGFSLIGDGLNDALNPKLREL